MPTHTLTTASLLPSLPLSHIHTHTQVAVMKMDQDQRGSIPFRTSTRGVPPPFVTTNFTVQDDGKG